MMMATIEQGEQQRAVIMFIRGCQKHIKNRVHPVSVGGAGLTPIGVIPLNEFTP